MRIVFAIIAAVILLPTLCVKNSFAQRVYANLATYNTGGLSGSVANPNNAALADSTSISTLTLGILSTVNYNLQFTGAIKPELNSPLYLKFGTNTSILGLLTGISIQKTSEGLNTKVGNVYSSNVLLAALNLIGNTNVGTLTMQSFDANYTGVQISLVTTVSLNFSASIYCAFIIAPPIIADTILCSGTAASFSISNHINNHKYLVYETANSTTPIDTITTRKFSIGQEINTSTVLIKDYFILALEDHAFFSARKKITATIHPKPTIPHISIN